MSDTPAQRAKMCMAMPMIDERTRNLHQAMIQAEIESAIAQARREERERCARIAESYKEQVPIPCPDGKPGCLVYHTRTQTPPQAHAIAAAIRQEDEDDS